MNVVGIPAELAAVPFGVVRPREAASYYANPAAQFTRLVKRGRLRRLAMGYYAVVPASADAHTWLPTLEAAGYGIAAADYGAPAVVLMGISAARHWGALPRAVGVCVVAVPKQRPTIRLKDRHADVIFVRRNTAKVDAQRITTDLGYALVTTVEQTALDLVHRPHLGGLETEALAAAKALLPRCEHEVLENLAAAQNLRKPLRRLHMHAMEE